MRLTLSLLHCTLCCAFGAAVWAAPAEDDRDRRDEDGWPLQMLIAPPNATLELKENDVVAFVGGENTVIEGEFGHFESLLRAVFPVKGLKFRNLGWEGDTVFDRPRDVNFPSLQDRVRASGATVIFCQFGQAESLAGPAGVEAFAKAYESLCADMAKQTSRIFLVAPVPFEKPADPVLPDLEPRNTNLRLYVDAVRAMAARRDWWCVDTFYSTGAGHCHHTLTDNGARLRPAGNALWGRCIVLDLSEFNSEKVDAIGDALSSVAGEDPSPSGEWKSQELETLRKAVAAKNKLWFDYTRPMNWAFLGGDRVQVAASHDHRDPNVRWFPGEMEKFVPLIEEADKKVDDAAQKAAAARPNVRRMLRVRSAQ